jgi:quinol monooxygenase YgiN
MLIQSIHFTFAAGDIEKAEALLRELRELSREEDGVVAFDVARLDGEPNVFVLWEEYRDQAALDAHVATQQYQRLVINGVRALAQERKAERLISL